MHNLAESEDKRLKPDFHRQTLYTMDCLSGPQKCHPSIPHYGHQLSRLFARRTISLHLQCRSLFGAQNRCHCHCPRISRRALLLHCRLRPLLQLQNKCHYSRFVRRDIVNIAYCYRCKIIAKVIVRNLYGALCGRVMFLVCHRTA